MRRTLFLVIGLLAWGTNSAHAQLFNFPFTTLRSGVSATTIVAIFGRGLNEDSGKLSAFGVTVARSGIGGRFSIRGGAGLVDSTPDSEMTFGGAVQARLSPATSPTALVVLAGVGYMKVDPVTLTRFPIGIGLTRVFTASSGTTISPGVTPRLEIGRASAGGVSTTETDFGASGGVTVRLPSGLGFGVQLDLTASDPNVWLIGGNVQYSFQ
jgi:hypothetical protein